MSGWSAIRRAFGRRHLLPRCVPEDTRSASLWPWLGFAGRLQGRGLGIKVIRPGLEFADARGLTAYLETENPRNVRLYERLGFRTAQFVPATEFPLNVDVWRMVRQAG